MIEGSKYNLKFLKYILLYDIRAFLEALIGPSMGSTPHVRRNDDSTNNDAAQTLFYSGTTTSMASLPINMNFSVNLNNSNYLLCRNHILSIIIAYGLELVIDSIMALPSQLLLNTSRINPKYAQLNRISNLIKS